MSDIRAPSKSILKSTAIAKNNSWFPKFNSISDVSNPGLQPRLSLFNFRKKPQPSFYQSEDNTQSIEDMISNELNHKKLKRVRFPAMEISVEYVFKKEDILDKRDIIMEPINIQTTSQLLSLYELICRKKGEPKIELFVSTLIKQPNATHLNRLDLSHQHINRHTITPLADIMYIDFGIKELILDGCGLEDDAIKILMHSLLHNDNITYLSLANNPDISTAGFKYIAIFTKASSQLVCLNLSYNLPDKKSIEYLTMATTKTASTSPSLSYLILNNCSLRPGQLEILASGMKQQSSCLYQIALRDNRFGTQGSLQIGVMLRNYSNIATGLVSLDLNGNNLNQGIQYIAQALKRNQTLKYLSLYGCKIDSNGCMFIGEALKYNQHIQVLNIGYNPLCSPDLEGIYLLEQGIRANKSLKDLGLENTGLGPEATIALAESLAENKVLLRIDLGQNIGIDLGGLMAISASIKLNKTIRCIDISIPLDDNEMVYIYNDVLAVCTRNSINIKPEVTDEAVMLLPNSASVDLVASTALLSLEERLEAVTRGKNGAKRSHSLSSSSSDTTLNNAPYTSKSAEMTNYNIMDNNDLIQKSFDCVGLLEEQLSDNQKVKNTLNHCEQLHIAISQRIPQLHEIDQIGLLLGVNDRLINAINAYHDKLDKEDIPLEASFEIGDDDDEEDDCISDSGEDLKQLRDRLEAEESAVFLLAKKKEEEGNAVD
ncbi:hypothetical protein BDB01DRAFT_831593 [Pilobolus umbonatus]|nr:hypothetical protein BDB01DRAFT_831593 [Pilobolus umbonatus]